eukprot:IDg18500t1
MFWWLLCVCCLVISVPSCPKHVILAIVINDSVQHVLFLDGNWRGCPMGVGWVIAIPEGLEVGGDVGGCALATRSRVTFSFRPSRVMITVLLVIATTGYIWSPTSIGADGRTRLSKSRLYLAWAFANDACDCPTRRRICARNFSFACPWGFNSHHNSRMRCLKVQSSQKGSKSNLR